MKSIGVFEAKARWVHLLKRVSRGEKILITKRRVPAAMLVPITEGTPKFPHQQIVEGMRALRTRVKAGKMSIREMVKEGRRY